MCGRTQGRGELQLLHRTRGFPASGERGGTGTISCPSPTASSLSVCDTSGVASALTNLCGSLNPHGEGDLAHKVMMVIAFRTTRHMLAVYAGDGVSSSLEST